MAHKADFLTFLQFFDGKTQALCFLPYVRLLHISHRKKQAFEPCGAETIEEVALVFLKIRCSLKRAHPPGFANANIVAGGHKFDSSRVRKLDETTQFDPLVAPDTGVGCCPFEIAGHKVVDDAGSKGCSGVDDLIRNFQCLCDKPCNTDLAAAAFLPTLRGSDGFIFVFPNLERDAVNVVPLANKERCRDRAVHSTAHSEKNCRASHTVAILLGSREKG